MNTTSDMMLSGSYQPAIANQPATIEQLIEISRNNAISTANLVQQMTNQSQQLAEVTTTVVDLVDRMNIREQNEVISSKQRKAFRTAVNKRVSHLLGLKKVNGKLTEESTRIRNVYSGLFYSRLYATVYDHFDISEYADIKAVDFNDAMSLVRTWDSDGDIGALKLEAEENWAANHPDQSVSEYLGHLF